MRHPGEVREIVRRRFDRSLADWLERPEEAHLSVPLHPPTAAVALADPQAVSAWIRAWEAAPAPLAGGVVWEERRWAQLGTQRVPSRWEVRGADLLARGAGGETAQQWDLLSARAEEARAVLSAAQPAGPSPLADPAGDGSRMARAIAGQRARWLSMSPVDAGLTIRAAAWCLAHPRSALRIRQVPVPGMHSKWLQGHRAVVERLVAAARADGSPELGLAPAPAFHDLLVLDPRLRGIENADGSAGEHAPLFPRSSRIDVTDLPGVRLDPDVVIICENAETVQVLPDLDGCVALSGAGYAVPTLLTVPWVAAAPVLYWGDLDADGFRILDRARHHHDRVTSVLMDAPTWEAHRSLAVHTKARAPAGTTMLTAPERDLHDALARSGERLEQERVELGFAVSALREAIARLLTDD